MNKFSNFGIVLGALALSVTSSFAGNSIPHCISNGQDLPIDNSMVVNLEHSTPNQYKTQAHVEGTVSKIYADHSGHKHFAIQFSDPSQQQDQNSTGIEVVYNTVFGALPDLEVGMDVEACGEYITSNAATQQYPASPMGAIIHWVHINPNQGVDQHASGFLVIDGEVYGQDASHAGHAGHRRRH